MKEVLRRASWPAAVLAAFTLAACGGSHSSHHTVAADYDAALITSEANAPQQTGNTATDGFQWLNFRRQQAGLQILGRNSLVDTAAQGHSDYQRINNVVSHVQESGKSGFTGVTLGDRLSAAGYRFTQRSYAYAEVISAAGTPSGAVAAEALITAIYHRFVIFEPMFREAGTGSSQGNGTTWFTANFVADGLNSGLGKGQFVTWPAAGQQRVPTLFHTDTEVPDPLPEQNAAGYPVSVHADIASEIGVERFILRERGGQPLPTRLLTSAADANTPTSAAAIVPLGVLRPATVYQVEFEGSIDGEPVSHAWSFTTR